MKRWSGWGLVVLGVTPPLVGWWGLSPQDVRVYFGFATKTFAGGVPYLDFPVEYPPLALAIFLLVRLVAADFATYVVVFVLLMALVDILQKLLVWRSTDRHRTAVLLLLAFASLGLYYPYLRRFDLVAVALTVVALTRQRKAPESFGPWVFLALAASVKLWPLLLAPLFWMNARTSGVALRRRLTVASAGLVVGLAVLGCAWIVAGDASLSWMHYHRERGLQLASTYASVLILFEGLGEPIAGSWGWGSNQLAGEVAEACARYSVWVMLGLVSMTVLRFSRRETSRRLERGSIAVVLALLLGSKVLSPQFLIWLIPLAAMAAADGERFDFRLALGIVLATALTSFTYPGEHRIAEGIFYKQLALIARNATLAVTWLYLMIRPLGGGAPPSPPAPTLGFSESKDGVCSAQRSPTVA